MIFLDVHLGAYTLIEVEDEAVHVPEFHSQLLALPVVAR